MTTQSNPDSAKHTVLFPINQDEQAVQSKADYLLAQDVFEKIADLLGRGLQKIERLKGLDDLDKHRAHEAILLQGARGSGKSAVLVNLQLYLEERHSKLANALLILKPIDPTLLENGEDMFLDVFIAALVRDKQVKAKLDQGGNMAEAFYDQLCKVGSALESSQTQKEQYGMDRVRALINGNGIAEQVHKLFQSALNLTGKSLIVLPIDDVDAALQHAYEKIEIVRKYLVSPFVIPLISGDLALYNDVIWRDFHGRLLTDSRAENNAAKDRAKELSIAYQRKILPLPRRIDVPALAKYLNNPEVMLVDNKDNKLLSFPTFKYWLEAVLNERVNGADNSYLPLPIDTVREFSQLVSHLQKMIFPLGDMLGALKSESLLEMRRLAFMTPEVAAYVAQFGRAYNDVVSHKKNTDRTKAREKAYLEMRNLIKHVPVNVVNGLKGVVREWQEAIKIYFLHHHNGGAVYLTLEANHHFWSCIDAVPISPISVFDTDLFRPQQHQKYKGFMANKNIRDEWSEHLCDRIPSNWMKNLPDVTILHYPAPEIGRRIWGAENAFSANSFKIGEKDTPDENDIEHAENAELIRRLMTHYSFYNKTNRATLVLTGRILELIITSLIRDVSESAVLSLIYRAPFYSASDMVNAKVFDQSANDDLSNDDDAGEENNVVGDTLTDLVAAINAWRKKNIADLATPPHARLIYSVINKYFAQVNNFNAPKSEKKEGVVLDVFGTALQAFNAIWAIFGGFEKGPIFGLDDVVAYRNVGDADKDFSKNQLYSQNILPFLQKNREGDVDSFFNFRTGSYTYLIASHPLRKFLQATYDSVKIFPNFNVAYVAPSIDTQINSKVNHVLSLNNINRKSIANVGLSILKKYEDAITIGLGEDANRIFKVATENEFKKGLSGLALLNALLVKIRTFQQKEAEMNKNIPVNDL